LMPEIAIVLAILVATVVMFVTERIQVDVVTLTVLVSLALTGLVTRAETLSGFANLAVVTVWAVLILSAGLARTGEAGQLVRVIAGKEGTVDGLKPPEKPNTDLIVPKCLIKNNLRFCDRSTCESPLKTGSHSLTSANTGGAMQPSTIAFLVRE